MFPGVDISQIALPILFSQRDANMPAPQAHAKPIARKGILCYIVRCDKSRPNDKTGSLTAQQVELMFTDKYVDLKR